MVSHLQDVLKFLNDNIYLLHNKSTNLKRKGQELYAEAKKIIPGGTQLLSKRPEMFLPDNWPAYYQYNSGIEITTLDGIKLKDFSIMGISTQDGELIKKVITFSSIAIVLLKYI